MIITKVKMYITCICVCCLFFFFFLQEVTAKSASAGDNEINIRSPRTALLVIDIQNDYFPGGKYELAGSDEASLQARKVLDVFRANDSPVIHIQHESQMGNPARFAQNTEGQKIHQNVIPLPGEPVYTKHYVSSFVQTPLLEHLRKENIKSLVIIGMQTNVCVSGAVVDGVKNGFELIVLSDATAARNTTTHNETLPMIETEGAKIMTVADFIQALSE